MKKRQLTTEQLAARDARRDKFRAITKEVGAMTDEQRARLVPTFGAVPTCEGRALSLKNTMLAVMQRPDVSMVGGFRQWIKMGRAVRKGEHGIMIWIPLGVGASPRAQDDAEASAEAGSGQRFGTATVFDIAQTVELAADDGCRFASVGKPAAAEEMERKEEPPADEPAPECLAVVPVRQVSAPAVLQFELISADVEISSAVNVSR